MKDEEIIGLQFGRWTVIDVIKKYKNGKTYCKCQCSCEKHTIKMVYKHSLLKGESKSCGCISREMVQERSRKDRVGERFDHLVVKKMLYQHRGEKTYCLCDCDCGNETIVYIGNLKQGRTSSCGCMEGISTGEILIKSILENNHINFIPQKRFDDCKNVLPLPFDFYLPDYNTLIEFDGIQHFEPVEHFGGVEEFKRRQINDAIKNQYSIDNNINLIRLPYTLSNNEIEKQILNIWNP